MNKINKMNHTNKFTFTGFSRVEYPITHFNVGHILFQAVTKFFNEYIKEGKYFILLRIKYKSGNYVTLHKGYIVTSDVLKEYLEHVVIILDFKNEEYKLEEEYAAIAFTYFKIPVETEDDFKLSPFKTIKSDKLIAPIAKTTLPLPMNMDYESWGDVLSRTPDRLVVLGDKNTYKINFHKEYNVMTVYVNRNVTYEIIDRKVKLDTENDLNQYFIRKFEDATFYCRVGDKYPLLTIRTVKTSYMHPLKKEVVHTEPKIATLDIETILKDGIQRPYLYSLYDGENKYSWFENNASNLFKHLLRRKYDGYQVYAHNLAKFDIVFLLKDLAKLTTDFNINIIKRDSNYIMIKISHKTKRVSVTLKDSYQLLPSALSDLSSQFGTANPKTIEPVYSPRSLKDPHWAEYGTEAIYGKRYRGVPDFEVWKKEAINYCENDCVALYQVIIKFRELVFNKFGILIDKYPTISSLAFGLYRTKYMPYNLIPILKGKIFDIAYSSYTGGSTEVYKPTGRNISCYDVNALYPTQMKEYKFPVGQIRTFSGDIEWLYKLNPNYTKGNNYWIGYAQVETKKDLYQPYLQVKHLGKKQGFEAQRTIAPNGSFDMMINCCEYYNALKDYNISIKSGLLFNAENIFQDYVDDIYNLRLQYEKHEPMNYICKLLLNSLYGRFAMRPLFTKSEFYITNKGLPSHIKLNEILDEEEITSNLSLISYNLKEEGNVDIELFSVNSVSIASAITAYARVYMSYFKNNPLFKLFYTDTDSAYIEGKLPDNLVGTELGKFKLENSYKEIVFLGPKVYAGKTEKGPEITKVKGFKNHVPFSIFKDLLNKNNNAKLSHIKWYRGTNNIKLRDQLYTLQQTAYKRDFIYNENNIAIDTKAFKVKNSQKISE